MSGVVGIHPNRIAQPTRAERTIGRVSSAAMLLGERTWPDLERPIVVVPVGACEQHGPHLPLATDTVVAEALADTLAAQRSDCVIAPTLAITASGEHAGFPGTLSIGIEVMTDVIVELLRSADGAHGELDVNGHGGNAAAMRRACEILDREGRRVLAWFPHVPNGDLHAGHTETSLLLALRPGLVRVGERTVGPVPDLAELVRHGVRALSDSGVLGDPTDASADDGHRIFDDLSRQLIDAVHDWVG